MKYLLDTNTCVRYINGRSLQLRQKLPTIPVKDIAVCSIVKAELFAGATKSQTPVVSRAKQENFLRLFPSLPFDDVAVQIYAPMRAKLEQRGTPIGPMDMLIAAISLANNLILVTHNKAEFSRIDGLTIEDWEL